MEAMEKIFGQVDTIKSEDDLEMITKRVAMNCAVSLWREQMAEKRGGNRVRSLDQLQEEKGDSYLAEDQAPKDQVEEPLAAPFAPTVKPQQLDRLDETDINNIWKLCRLD
jgi:hypothetical protein